LDAEQPVFSPFFAIPGLDMTLFRALSIPCYQSSTITEMNDESVVRMVAVGVSEV